MKRSLRAAFKELQDQFQRNAMKKYKHYVSLGSTEQKKAFKKLNKL